MVTYSYPVLIEPDVDGGFVVTCPSLRGCISQGDTVDEALENIREAMVLSIEHMRQIGESIPHEVTAHTVQVAV